MDTRLRSSRAETITTTAICTHTGKDGQSEQVGPGCQGRESSGTPHDRPRCRLPAQGHVSASLGEAKHQERVVRTVNAFLAAPLSSDQDAHDLRAFPTPHVMTKRAAPKEDPCVICGRGLIMWYIVGRFMGYASSLSHMPSGHIIEGVGGFQQGSSSIHVAPAEVAVISCRAYAEEVEMRGFLGPLTEQSIVAYIPGGCFRPIICTKCPEWKCNVLFHIFCSPCLHDSESPSCTGALALVACHVSSTCHCWPRDI